MSNTTMPGFRAEAACYRGGARYRVGSMAAPPLAQNEVIPARYYYMVSGQYGLYWGNDDYDCTWDYETGVVECEKASS